MENLCKNNLRFVKYIPMIYVKFITIMFTISGKNGRHYIHTNLKKNNNNKQKEITNADSKQLDETM